MVVLLYVYIAGVIGVSGYNSITCYNALPEQDRTEAAIEQCKMEGFKKAIVLTPIE